MLCRALAASSLTALGKEREEEGGRGRKREEEGIENEE